MNEKEHKNRFQKLENSYRENIFKLIFILLKENDLIEKSKEIIESEIEEISEEDKIVFETIFELYKTEDNITSLKVKKTIKSKWNLNYNDYFLHINEIIKSNKKDITFENIIKDIKDTYKKIKLLENLVNTSNDFDANSYDMLVDSLNKNIDKLSSGKKLSNKQEQFNNFREKLHKARENFGNNKLSGFRTYIEDLDNFCLGIDEESFNIVAARPAMGKSAFILSIIANHIKYETNETLVVFSLEMPADQLISRVAAILSNVTLSKIRSGNLNDKEFQNILKYIDIIEKSNLIIEDESTVTIFDITDKLKDLKRKQNISAVFIDYLQLINGHSGVTDRRLVVDEISRRSKLLAKEIKAPIFALSQLNRKLEERADKRPMLSDLRESGGLEQDADRVMFIHRQSVYDNKDVKKTKEADEITEDISEIILAKNRNGSVGTVFVKYLQQITYFKSANEEEVGFEILDSINQEMLKEANNMEIDISTDKTFEIEIVG